MAKKTNLKSWLVMAVILVALAGPAAGEVIYVDADASTGGNGTTWGTAYKYLQDALYKPPTGGDQIWVAAGTYYPDEDEAANVTPGDRTATFQLINGVALYGGFAGGESTLDERDWQTNVTILSGDLNGDDVGFTNSEENSYHVVTGSGTDVTAVLDGFTITAGNAEDDRGAGMYNTSGSPTVTNCTFSGNWSCHSDAGGMYNYRSCPTVTNCTFSGNFSADCGGGMGNWNSSSPTVTNCTFSTNRVNRDGGGMFNIYESCPTVTNCTFSGNWSYYSDGGGMANWNSSSPTVTNCTFSGNSASSTGGGMYNYNSSNPTVTNCTFSENSSAWVGGGMDNYRNSNPTVTNCTFSGNSASSYYGGGMCSRDYSGPTLVNCILWGNTASDGNEIALFELSTIDVNYCDVKGGQTDIYNDGTGTVNWGSGNIDADPLFVDADLRLSAGSPCIDAGDNTAVSPDTADLDNDVDTSERTPLDLDGHFRFVDGDCNTTHIVDMGAYEFAFVYLGDLDGDCNVDFADFARFAGNWLAGK